MAKMRDTGINLNEANFGTFKRTNSWYGIQVNNQNVWEGVLLTTKGKKKTLKNTAIGDEFFKSTIELLKIYPEVTSIMVAKLTSGRKLPAHRGDKSIKRIHLGLVVPEGDISFRVRGEDKKWEEGKCLAFNDFYEHEAWNNTNQDRINLTGSSSLLINLKILVGFGLFGLASLNLLAKKESSIFASAQFIYGAIVFYFISLLVSRSELVVFTDSLMIASLHNSTLIYVGVSFIFLAIIHFLMTKPLGATLFNKTLTAITFWGFLFLLPWTNFKYYFGSVIPNWLENVSIYLSLSLLIPLLAFSVNYIKTIQTKEDEGNKSSDLMSFSVILFLITNLLHIISSFENILPLVGQTNFQYEVNQGYIGSLIFATISFVYYLIPKLFGRSVKYSRLEDLIFSGIKFLYPALLINNFLIGINSGYSWNAGANAGSPTIYGEGFSILWSVVSINYSANTFISLLLMTLSFLFFISVVRSISSGDVTTVEEMVFSNE